MQIRPWKLSDADFVLDASLPLDPRKTVFVGGVPRPLKAGKLFIILLLELALLRKLIEARVYMLFSRIKFFYRKSDLMFFRKDLRERL